MAQQKKKQLGLKELLAMGVGGIFSVLGRSVGPGMRHSPFLFR